MVAQHLTTRPDLLREIPTGLDLVDVAPELINESWPGWQLWTLLESMYGIGWVTAGKLVARKRPASPWPRNRPGGVPDSA